ncbi:MAG TPA: DUF2845 domain-containing protein [Syntrophales bacterium]|nr:DUF2845 domain-containing protein [Syntrophales bacterium]HOL58723.1 DUF2845 domain-containing protein [Syntrophales bacterium]HPO34989.1 DUF2845 domain-containing protein [Syntrophales bacterium]
MRGTIALMVAALLSLPCPSAALRCGKGLVVVGDIKAKVLAECGEPQYREKVRLKEDPYLERKGGRKKSGRHVEQWTYNCGEDDFMYVLTFDGGKLIKEEPVGRGKGASKCRGN